MKKVKDIANMLWEFCKGKKSYLIGVVLVLIGLDQKNEELIGLGLATLGLRYGITTEVTRLFDSLRKGGEE